MLPDTMVCADWIISQALTAAENKCLPEAKSWLLTGVSIFPNNFQLKFETYMLLKSSNLLPEAAQQLAVIYGNSSFSQEELLLKEINTLVDSIKSETQPTDQMSVDIFSYLPEEVQCKILKQISAQTTDVIARCSVLLLLVKRFPFLTREFGSSLIESLFEAELKERPGTIRNIYREYFVHDALPMILQDTTGTDRKILLNWLDKAMQYYLVTAFSSLNKSGLTSPTVKSHHIARPWESLAALLAQAGRYIKWGIHTKHFRDDATLLQYLIQLADHLSEERSKSQRKEFIYNLTYLLMKKIHAYISSAKTSTPPIFLLHNGVHSKKHKKVPPPDLLVNISIHNGEVLRENFKSACDAWTMIHRDSSFTKAYAELLDRLDFEQWNTSVAPFLSDLMIYKQEYRDFLSKNQSQHYTHIRLQRAYCHLSLGQYKESVQLAMELIATLKSCCHSSKNQCRCNTLQQISDNSLQYQFISDPDEMLGCVFELILQILKVVLNRGGDICDDLVGNIIALLQWSWPLRRPLFTTLIEQIKTNGSFGYSTFFDYIINVDMLEEFAYLHSEQGGKVTLDIMPTSVQEIAKQRTLTRGVMRDVKEDFASTFEKQVSRSGECLQALLLRLCIERKDSILESITGGV